MKKRVLPVSYFLLADSAGFLLCNYTFNLLVEDSLLLHLKTQNTFGASRDRQRGKLDLT